MRGLSRVQSKISMGSMDWFPLPQARQREPRLRPQSVSQIALGDLIQLNEIFSDPQPGRTTRQRLRELLQAETTQAYQYLTQPRAAVNQKRIARIDVVSLAP